MVGLTSYCLRIIAMNKLTNKPVYFYHSQIAANARPGSKSELRLCQNNSV